MEYSLQYKPHSDMEPYYPINSSQNHALYQKYKNDLSVCNNLFICGRLADFKYYNMDQTLFRALETCEEIDIFLKSGSGER